MTNRPRLASPGFLFFVCLVYFILQAAGFAVNNEGYALEYVSSFGGGSDWIQYGDAVYLFQGRCIRILDLSDPKNPRERGMLNMDVKVEEFILKPPAVYLATQKFGEHSAGFQMLDLTDPWNPKFASHDISLHYTKFEIGLALAADSLTIQGKEYDVTDPLNPTLLKDPDELDETTTKTQRVRSIPPKYALPRYSTSKDNAGSSISTIIKSWTDFDCNKIKIQNGTAYCLGNKALHLIDIRDPQQPRRLGKFVSGVEISSMAISGKYALLTEQSPHLIILEISNPTSPTLLSRIALPAAGGPIAVSGSKAYVEVSPPESEDEKTTITEPSGMQIVDFATPTNPRLMGFYKTHFNDIVVSGSLAYLAHGKLEIVNVSDPSNPVRMGMSSPPEKTSIDLSRHDTNDSDDTKEKAVFGAVDNINLSGRQVIAMGPTSFRDAKGSQYGFINFFDVSNPRKPVWTDAMDFGQYCGVKVVGNFIYAQTHYSSTTFDNHNLSLYRLDGPKHESALVSNSEFDEIVDVDVDENMIYVADDNRLVILQR